MAINIKQILSKKNLTGDEVGKALLYNTAASYEKLLETRDYQHEPSGIFTQEDMNRMVMSLKTNYDIDRYNAYVSLNNYIAKEQGFANAYRMQTELGYYRIFQQLQSCMDAEMRFEDLSEIPLIVTQKQYDDYAEVIKKENRSFYETYLTFLYDIYEFYYEKYKYNKNTENPLAAAIEASKEKVIKNPRILQDYVNIRKRGHYITADGISSDDCTIQKWSNIIDKIIYGEEIQYNSNIEKKTNKHTNDDVFANSSLTGYEINIIKEGLYNANRYVLNDKNIPEHIKESLTWVWDLDKVPKELKADIVMDDLEVYYSNIFGYDTQYKTVSQELIEFKTDFPELWDALVNTAATLLPATKDYKIDSKSFRKPLITWGELADKEILDFSQKTSKVSSYQIADYINRQDLMQRIIFNGICVLKQEDEKTPNIDERGYYKNDKVIDNLFYQSIQSLGTNEAATQHIEYARNLELYEGLAEIYAYNAMLDIVTEITEVDVSIFSMKYFTDVFEQELLALNGVISSFYQKIKDNALLFKEKDRAIRDIYARTIFPKIDFSKVKPKPAAIQKTKAYVADMKAFTANTPLIIEMLKEKGVTTDE